MKKKIIGGFVVAAIAALATFNINVNMSTHNGLSAVSLANVEALANNENPVITPCAGVGNGCSFSCVVDGVVRDCHIGGYRKI